MQVLVTMASDLGVLAQILAMGMEEPHHYEEIAPLPHVDPPVPEDEVPIEMNEDEDDEGNYHEESWPGGHGKE